MIQSDIINVQARTIEALDKFGKPVNASVFGAYGLQLPSSDVQGQWNRFHLEMNSERTGQTKI